jgi:hypothetical protein
VIQDHLGTLRDEDYRSSFMTVKEHPVIKGRIVHYLHECQMPEMFKEKAANQVAKWASVVFPSVFGMEVVSLEAMKSLVKSDVYNE